MWQNQTGMASFLGIRQVQAFDKAWTPKTAGYRFKVGVPTNRAFRAVVVAQLVERSLPTPEIHGVNPDIGKILSTNCTIEKTKIKKKSHGMAHFKKKENKTLIN